MTPNEARHIFCIGIGGIGISGLAKIFAAQGKHVSGIDAVRSDITDELVTMGMAVHIGESDAVIPQDVDLLIYSEAVPFSHPLRRAAHERNIEELSGAQAIAWFTKNKYTIAIAGTNGKSTTTAMLGFILQAAGKDPMVLVGSRVDAFPMKNVRIGKSDLFVLEADEYKEKFLNYKPNMIVVTNVEADHLDTYRDVQHVRETFDNLLAKIHRDGFVILNKDDAGCGLLHTHGNVMWYGMQPLVDYRATELRVVHQKQIFRLLGKGGHDFGEFTLRVPGAFNVANALGAIAAALTLGVTPETAAHALAEFGGLWRRFELVGTLGSGEDAPLIISDYGHHPTAIAKTIAATREFYPSARIVLVYQPHQLHRTRALFPGFVQAIPTADLVLLSEIYDVAGREDAGAPISSKNLVDAIAKPHVQYVGDLAATEAAVRAAARPGDIILVMGAGTIDEVARKLTRS